MKKYNLKEILVKKFKNFCLLKKKHNSDIITQSENKK